MKAKGFLIDSVITILITFVVAVVVTYLYSAIAHGSGAINWETAFQLAVIVGIAMPLSRVRSAGNKTRQD